MRAFGVPSALDTGGLRERHDRAQSSTGLMEWIRASATAGGWFGAVSLDSVHPAEHPSRGAVDPITGSRSAPSASSEDLGPSTAVTGPGYARAGLGHPIRFNPREGEQPRDGLKSLVVLVSGEPEDRAGPSGGTGSCSRARR